MVNSYYFQDLKPLRSTNNRQTEILWNTEGLVDLLQSIFFLLVTSLIVLLTYTEVEKVWYAMEVDMLKD